MSSLAIVRQAQSNLPKIRSNFEKKISLLQNAIDIYEICVSNGASTPDMYFNYGTCLVKKNNKHE